MSSTNRPSSSISKDSLLFLTARKLAPTPLIFALAHREITGEPDGEILFPSERGADLERVARRAPQALAAFSAGLAKPSQGSIARLFALPSRGAELSREGFALRLRRALTPLLGVRQQPTAHFELLLAGEPRTLDEERAPSADCQAFAVRCDRFADAQSDVDQSMRRISHSLSANGSTLAEVGPHADSRVQSPFRVAESSSLRAASIREAARDAWDLFDRQDQNLRAMLEHDDHLIYRAKNNGKSRLFADGDDTHG